MATGFIKLHRELMENELWQEKPFARGQAWVDLIMIANYEEGRIRVRGNRLTVKRGQVGWSVVRLADRWGWSRGKVQRFLDELQCDQQIVQQKNNVTSLITIVNYDKYQQKQAAERTPDGQQTDTNKEEKEEKERKDSAIAPAAGKPPPCPHEQIIALYHETLPACRHVAEWTSARRSYLQARWREKAERQTLDWWREFFAYVAESDFLTGRVDGRGGAPPFVADLEWLIRPTNFAKVVEGKYHRDDAA